MPCVAMVIPTTLSTIGSEMTFAESYLWRRLLDAEFTRRITNVSCTASGRIQYGIDYYGGESDGLSSGSFHDCSISDFVLMIENGFLIPEGDLLPDPARTPPTGREEWWRDLPPDVKLTILTAMGFVAIWEDHQPSCVYADVDGDVNHTDEEWPGIICNCVPPGTSWGAPREVGEFMGETWDDLKALAHTRDENYRTRRP